MLLEYNMNRLSGDFLLTVPPKSLKAVLLHNGTNIRQFLSLTQYKSKKAVKMSRNYCLKQIMLNSIGMFVVILRCWVFLGLQGGCTKYSCFLCLWNSRADGEHYEKIHWLTREELMPGRYNVIKEPLVSREKVLLPLLHIKLGLLKQFVKALDFKWETFQEIRAMFPKLSDAKLKGGKFVGPQIPTMLKSRTLEEKMTEREKKTWQAFRCVVEVFLRKNKDSKYKELAKTLIKTY